MSVATLVVFAILYGIMQRWHADVMELLILLAKTNSNMDFSDVSKRFDPHIHRLRHRSVRLTDKSRRWMDGKSSFKDGDV